MKLNITLLPPDWIDGLWDQLLPYMQETAYRSRGRVSVEDLKEFIHTGYMNVWAVYDEETNKVCGHFMTEVKQYPKMKMLVVQYAAMLPNHMEQIEDRMQVLAESFAKDAGCEGIEFVGRPGWKNHATKYGYTAQSVMYQKFFRQGLT